MSELKSDHRVAERARFKQRINQTVNGIYCELRYQFRDNADREWIVVVLKRYTTSRVRSELQRARRGPRPR